MSQIKWGGKPVYLGFYDEQEAAAEAYDQALILLKARPRAECVGFGTWSHWHTHGAHVEGGGCSRS